MEIDIYSFTPFRGDSGWDLHPDAFTKTILRAVIGVGLLVWALAIWKAAEVVLS